MKTKSLLMMQFIVFSMALAGCQGTPKGEWYENYSTVCHAMGRTQQGDTLTNSLEAFEYNYEKGQRVFEVDLAITSDQVMVLRHDWDSDLGQMEAFGWTEDQKTIPAAEEFLNTPIYGIYTPMSLLDLYEIMDQKKEIYVVLDPKYSSEVKEQFTLLVNTAIENGYEKVLDRIVVQLYYGDMYDEVTAVYPFKNYVLTLYYIGYAGGEETAGFCAEKGIPVLVMPYTWINTQIMEEVRGYGVNVFVHTVNDEADAGYMGEMGVDGIYTDDLLTFPLEPDHP